MSTQFVQRIAAKIIDGLEKKNRQVAARLETAKKANACLRSEVQRLDAQLQKAIRQRQEAERLGQYHKNRTAILAELKEALGNPPHVGCVSWAAKLRQHYAKTGGAA